MKKIKQKEKKFGRRLDGGVYFVGQWGVTSLFRENDELLILLRLTWISSPDFATSSPHAIPNKLKAPPWLYSSIFMNMRKIWNARETRKAVLNFLWGNIREFVLRFPVPTFAVVAPPPYYDFVCVLLSFCKYIINNRFAWQVLRSENLQKSSILIYSACKTLSCSLNGLHETFWGLFV